MLVNNNYPNQKIDKLTNNFIQKKMIGPTSSQQDIPLNIYYNNQMHKDYKVEERVLKEIICNNVKSTDPNQRINVIFYYKNRRTANLIMRNNLNTNHSDLQQTNVIYNFMCPLPHCKAEQYIGLTQTTLSRRLTMHAQAGSIFQHFKTKHQAKPTRIQLTENTTIIARAENRFKLAIKEALLILHNAPDINKQFDNFTSILKLHAHRNNCHNSKPFVTPSSQMHTESHSTTPVPTFSQNHVHAIPSAPPIPLSQVQSNSIPSAPPLPQNQTYSSSPATSLSQSHIQYNCTPSAPPLSQSHPLCSPLVPFIPDNHTQSDSTHSAPQLLQSQFSFSPSLTLHSHTCTHDNSISPLSPLSQSYIQFTPPTPMLSQKHTQSTSLAPNGSQNQASLNHNHSSHTPTLAQSQAGLPFSSMPFETPLSHRPFVTPLSHAPFVTPSSQIYPHGNFIRPVSPLSQSHIPSTTSTSPSSQSHGLHYQIPASSFPQTQTPITCTLTSIPSHDDLSYISLDAEHQLLPSTSTALSMEHTFPPNFPQPHLSQDQAASSPSPLALSSIELPSQIPYVNVQGNSKPNYTNLKHLIVNPDFLKDISPNLDDDQRERTDFTLSISQRIRDLRRSAKTSNIYGTEHKPKV